MDWSIARLPWRAFLLCIAVATLCAYTFLPEPVEEPGQPVRPRRTWKAPTPVNPEVVKLIDQLVEVSQEGVGFHSTAWAGGFLALDAEPQFGGGILGSKRPVEAPALRKLVRKGVAALPDLLNHLDDPRETQLGVSPFMGAGWFSDEYDPRYTDPKLQPTKVNKLDGGGPVDREWTWGYKVCVGDLCYVAVGQIVNRHLCAVRYQPTGCLVINSPVQTPALAEAVRADWGGLTAHEHRWSLVQDVQDAEAPWSAPQALVRLCYYYPEQGTRLTVKSLAPPDPSEACARVLRLVCTLRTGHFEEAVRQMVLNDRQEWWNFEARTRLIAALESQRSEAIDLAVRRLFLATDLNQFRGLDRVYTDDFVLACLNRLAGKGIDQQLEAYCTKRIRELNGRQREFAEEQRLELLRAALERVQAVPVAVEVAPVGPAGGGP